MLGLPDLDDALLPRGAVECAHKEEIIVMVKMNNVMLTAAVVICAACGGEHANRPPMRADSVTRTSSHADIQTQSAKPDARTSEPEQKPTGTLCLMRKTGEDAQLLPVETLIDKEPDMECVTSGAALDFELTRDEERSFWLYGFAGVTYCLAVERQLGYLEVTRDAGVLRWAADGLSFSWCAVSGGDGQPVTMTIRCRTNRSKFRLSLGI